MKFDMLHIDEDTSTLGISDQFYRSTCARAVTDFISPQPLDVSSSNIIGARGAEQSPFITEKPEYERPPGRPAGPPASHAFEKFISPELYIRASRSFHCQVDPFYKKLLQPDWTHLVGRPGG